MKSKYQELSGSIVGNSIIEIPLGVHITEAPRPAIQDSGQREDFTTGAVRDIRTGKGRFDLISPFMCERLAKWYEAGASKYGDRNWEKGMPFSRFIDSALRHINKYRQGLKDEDHAVAGLWNLAAIIHFEELGMEELNDLPKYKKSR